MNVKILRVLMWGTIAAAVAGAMLLAAHDDALPHFGSMLLSFPRFSAA